MSVSLPSTPHTLHPSISRACPVCGSTDETHVFAEANFDTKQLNAFAFASRKQPEYMHYRLITCPQCDLLYANPLPATDTLATAYEEAAYDSGDEAQYAARTYAAILNTFLPQLPDRDGALDIGAGDGAFLEQLRKANFTNIIGVEPSSAPIAAAAESVRPFLRQSMFQAGDFAAESLRLITCFQTMEHLPDPLGMCYEAHRLLKTEGALFLIGHDRRSLVNRLLGKKSPIFDIEHLQLFSPASARALLAQSGFTDIQVRPITNRYPLRYWLRLFPLPARLKAFTLSLLDKTGLGRLPLALPVGNLAAIGFKRSQPQ